MVSVSQFLVDADSLFNEIQKREKDAENNRYKEFIAARNIQRCVRGFLERHHIAYLHESALIIQKNWRGYCGRKIYVQLLKETVEKMLKDYYNGMATKIQKIWRGHVVRLYVYDHRLFRQWMSMVMMKNKEKHYDNKSFEESSKDADEYAAEMKAKDQVLFIHFKVHHILRTYGVPGICSLLDTNQLSLVEMQLQEMKLFDDVQKLHKKREEMRFAFGESSPVNLPLGIKHRKCEEFWANRIRVGKPPLFVQEKYQESAAMQEAVNRQYDVPAIPMQFTLEPCNDRPLMDKKEPFSETHIPLRDTHSSRYIVPGGFVLEKTCDDPSMTYQPSKYGPYIPDISKTDIFMQKYDKECSKQKKKKNK